MDHFQRKGGALFAEGVPLEAIAERYGTPTYVYSRATITRHVEVLRQGLSNIPHLVCYAVKANGNLAILELLHTLGCHFDAVSVGELARTLKVGAPTDKTIFSGVGKRDDEIAAALRAGVLYISVESADELEAVNRAGCELGIEAPVSIRVNPDVDAQTHPYISTGLKQNKFGVPSEAARDLYRQARAMKGINPIGVACHIGSQITQMRPFEDAAHHMANLARDLQDMDVPLKYIGMGGGLGIPYRHETPPSPDEYGASLARVLKGLSLTLVVEPGRVIVGNAGVLLTRVVRHKEGSDRRFLMIDAGMNDLLRPALYDAHHGIEQVSGYSNAQAQPVDIVGPVCESADTFVKAALLQAPDSGELLALRSAGAYGFVMSSNYNGRPRPAEVLVDGEQMTLIRERESIADLWRGERSLGGIAYDSTAPDALQK